MPGNYRTSGALTPRHATVGLVRPRFELRDRDRRRFKDKAAVLLRIESEGGGEMSDDRKAKRRRKQEPSGQIDADGFRFP